MCHRRTHFLMDECYNLHPHLMAARHDHIQHMCVRVGIAFGGWQGVRYMLCFRRCLRSMLVTHIETHREQWHCHNHREIISQLRAQISLVIRKTWLPNQHNTRLNEGWWVWQSPEMFNSNYSLGCVLNLLFPPKIIFIAWEKKNTHTPHTIHSSWKFKIGWLNALNGVSFGAQCKLASWSW